MFFLWFSLVFHWKYWFSCGFHCFFIEKYCFPMVFIGFSLKNIGFPLVFIGFQWKANKKPMQTKGICNFSFFLLWKHRFFPFFPFCLFFSLSPRRLRRKKKSGGGEEKNRKKTEEHLEKTEKTRTTQKKPHCKCLQDQKKVGGGRKEVEGESKNNPTGQTRRINL